jgi:carbonic anhydrase
MLSARDTVSVLCLSLVFVGCTTMSPSSSDPPKKYWSYVPGDSGPNDWAKIEGYKKCGEGQQSPIVLDGARYRGQRIEYDYQRQIGLNLLNDGHTVKNLADTTLPSMIRFEGVDYRFHQFHFHTPSEHAFPVRGHPDGGRTKMELHIVHVTPDNTKTAAIAILIDEDRNAVDQPAYQTLFNVLPNNGGLVRETGQLIDFFGLFPPNRTDFFTYDGSLTTPDCAPVKFIVLKDRVALKPGQIDGLRSLFNVQTPQGNSRPINELTVPLFKNFQ